MLALALFLLAAHGIYNGQTPEYFLSTLWFSGMKPQY
jgi:hypothetical protein